LLTDEAKKKYHPIKVRAITMSDEVAASLDYESKLSRDPSQLRLLKERCLKNTVKTARGAF